MASLLSESSQQVSRQWRRLLDRAIYEAREELLPTLPEEIAAPVRAALYGAEYHANAVQGSLDAIERILTAWELAYPKEATE